jgi:glycyl-tRNA synthetase beta chain
MASGRLLNKFLIVSNMQVDDPATSSAATSASCAPPLGRPLLLRPGPQERLCHPRRRLGSVVYHHKLGSLGDRAQRMGRIARSIAERLGAEANLAEARGAVRQDRPADRHGRRVPRTAGNHGPLLPAARRGPAGGCRRHRTALPAALCRRRPAAGNIACAAALADKLDSLVGFFGIGQLPTGDKDPFGLRRAALGVLRILMETPLPLDLGELIKDSKAALPAGNPARRGR